MSNSDNVKLSGVEYTGLRLRLAAFLLDCIVILGYIIILTAVGLGTMFVIKSLQQLTNLFAKPLFLDLITFITLILPVILYFTLQESSPKQATWGKCKVGLRLITASGKPLSKGKAFVRSPLKFLPWQLAHTSIYHIKGWPFAPEESPTPLVMTGLVLVWVIIGIYLISFLVTKTHRTPYDWLTGTFVIVTAYRKNVT